MLQKTGGSSPLDEKLKWEKFGSFFGLEPLLAGSSQDL